MAVLICLINQLMSEVVPKLSNRRFAFLEQPHLYIKNISGANDGMVSEISARWSDNIIKLENISHAEIIDIKNGKYLEMIYPAFT